MITLQQIRDFALARADMQNSNFRNITNLNYMVNTSIEELYDLIVSRFEDYYVEQFQFTINAPDDGYTIPVPVYKLRGIDAQINADWVTLNTFTFEERNIANRNVNRGFLGVYSLRYRWVGSQIKMVPQDQAPGVYRAWYIPRFTDLVNDTDTLQADLEQWVDYIVVDVGIKLLQQEESDTSVLMAQKEALKQRIQAMASNRDAGNPQRITDVSVNYWWDDFFLGR